MTEWDEQRTLFVYGSLLNPGRRRQIIGHQVKTIAAVLHDYELGCAQYFFIRKQPGITTQGLLLLNLSSQDFDRLDRYEELPHLYTREMVEVVDQSGKSVRCWVYLPTASTLTGNRL
jgi:gamma-glutamylcyclotransferase (GGCT)/AIG2-like uncharacterized protein YtfP